MNVRSRLRNLIARNRGNAVLFSLIIMASAMTISLGMTSLVVGEVRSVSLVLPSEHAYYKAESYVEQALWNKKADPNYQFKPATNSSGVVTPPVGQQLPATYLCGTPPCFLTAPTSQATLLKQFYATTAPDSADVEFPADVSRQYDISTANGTGAGSLTISNIAPHEEQNQVYKGLEVSIIAYPVVTNPTLRYPVEQDNPNTAGTVEGANSPVFVDKVFIPAGTNTFTTDINQGAKTRNPIGEPYLPLDSSTIYRLRIKSLGADTEADVRVNSGAQTLDLQSPDFTVRAVAEDGNSRRGIQVLTPNTEQLASIFDYVLFSDLDLDKLGAKVPPKSVVANVYRDINGDCVRDPDDPGIPNLLVTARANSVDQVATTNDTGTVSFIGLKTGTAYTLSTSLPAGYAACTPPGNDQAFDFSGNSTEVKQMSFLLRQVAASPTPAASVQVNGRNYASCQHEGTGAYCLTDYATYPNSVYFFCGADGNQPGACGTNNAPAVVDYQFTGMAAGTHALTFNYYNYPNAANPPPNYSYRIRIDYPGGTRTVNLPIESTDASRNLHTFTVNNLAVSTANPTIRLTWDNDAFTGGDANFGLNWVRLGTATP